MHEFSLVHALLDQVDAIRREQHAERVVSIRVSVGEFAGVEPELFREAFQILIAETAMRGAELQMHCVPLQACCEDCKRRFTVARFRFECPECNGDHVTIERGQDIVLDNVTIEHSEEPALDSAPTKTDAMRRVHDSANH